MIYGLRDPQLAPVVAYCANCGGEIYHEGSDLCDYCKDRGNETLVEYARKWPFRLFAFLADISGEPAMEPFFEAFREYCVGSDATGPDFERWLRNG